MKVTKYLLGALACAVCASCASGPERVLKQASLDVPCDSSQVTVTRTQPGGYMRNDHYEAQGCGKKVAYECERAYVLMIPTGVSFCRKD